MINIFRFLKDFKKTLLVIIVLLITQAYCDLALPSYMSNIIDIGIQQSGIQDVTPKALSKQTLDELCLFLNQSEEKTVRRSYEEKEDGQYKLKTKDEAQIKVLDDILGVPLIMISEPDYKSISKMDKEKGVKAQAPDKKALLEIREQVKSQLSAINESIIKQKAILAVKAEYEKLNIDVHQIQTQYLTIEGLKMLGLSVLILLTAAAAGYLASKVAATVGMNLRNQVFRKVIEFSNTELNHFSTASLITRSTNDIQQIQMVSVMLLRMVAYAPIMGIGGLIKVASTHTGMGWIIAVAVALVLSLVTVLVGITMPKFKKMQVLVDRLNLVSRELLTGLPVIRAFRREKFEEARFKKANASLKDNQLFTNRVMTLMMPSMTLIMNGITVLIVWIGAGKINSGYIQVGDMMAFITYTMQIIMSFLMLTMLSVMLPRAGVAADRIKEVLDVVPTIQDTKDCELYDNKCFKGELTFDNVSFKYESANEAALEKISFTAKPGQITAIIGSTGAGKSTLIHLISRFYDVTSGKIMLDGVDIRDISQEKLRSLLGLVPQKSILFSGDIASNIKFAGEKVSDKEMKEAASIAQAVPFIEDTKEKYQHPISQGGSNVSGGQKQRLCIARAIAKHPKVVLFDDSFSALDYKTDWLVREALTKKMKQSTVIIVAQRISTILHADQIIVLEEGKVVGIGDHKTLLKSNPTYQEIAKSQLSEAELRREMNE